MTPLIVATAAAAVAGLIAGLALGKALGGGRAAAPERRPWTSMRAVQIGEFLSFVLYQLREYLISVTSLVEALALSAPKDQPAFTEKLERLRRVVGELNVKASRLLGDRSAVTTQASGKRTSFGVAEVVEECLSATRQAYPSIPASFAKEGTVPAITGDRRGLQACVLAVLDNAFQSCARAGRGRVTVTLRAADRRAQIEVSDEGGGIDEETQRGLFEPLHAARGGNDGLGLGVPMTRRVIERLGGSIRVKSKPPFTAVLLEVPLRDDLPFVRNEESTWAGRRDKV
jgi:signal transduction histidine kinase